MCNVVYLVCSVCSVWCVVCSVCCVVCVAVQDGAFLLHPWYVRCQMSGVGRRIQVLSFALGNRGEEGRHQRGDDRMTMEH